MKCRYMLRTTKYMSVCTYHIRITYNKNIPIRIFLNMFLYLLIKKIITLLKNLSVPQTLKVRYIRIKLIKRHLMGFLYISCSVPLRVEILLGIFSKCKCVLRTAFFL